MILSARRLEEILARLPALRVAVVGDFFLDKYLVTDPGLSEVSVETGLEARQVVEIRCSPGAAGTVTNNLSALGVGRIEAVGVIGQNGEGFDLARGLEATRVATTCLLHDPSRFTPTYTKPMVREGGRERELERLDIKNRTALPSAAEDAVLGSLREMLPGLDAVVVADQVQERNCGVVTDRVRGELAALAAQNPGVVFLADSRVRIGEFRGVLVKPNLSEGRAACGIEGEPAEVGTMLARRTGRPVFVTAGERGIWACDGDQAWHAPAVRVEGPIDIVGAGDSATAGIVTALCAGATLEEAAALGCLCASVTIRKLGTTGTASPAELRAALAHTQRQHHSE